MKRSILIAMLLVIFASIFSFGYELGRSNAGNDREAAVKSASIHCVVEGVKAAYRCLFFEEQSTAHDEPRQAFGWYLSLEDNPRIEAAIGQECWNSYQYRVNQVEEALLQANVESLPDGLRVFNCVNGPEVW